MSKTTLDKINKLLLEITNLHYSRGQEVGRGTSTFESTIKLLKLCEKKETELLEAIEKAINCEQ